MTTDVVLPPLTLLRVLTAWRAEPGVLVAVLVLGGGYLLALRRRTKPWPRARTACYLSGVALVGLLGCSFVGVYDDTLFWTRALQNMALVMVVPMLLALGAPIRLVADLLPEHRRAPLRRILHSTPLRLATFPVAVTVLLVVPLIVLYVTPLYELTLRSGVASGVSAVVVTGVGFIYFWTRFRIDPTPRADSHLVTLSITIIDMIGDAVLGVVLWLGPLVAAAFYAALTRDWGPSLRTDQTIGAGILWIGGDVVGLPFILLVAVRMSREDAQHAAVVDARLDQDDLRQADGAAPRLWWEDHPELAQRFRRGQP